MSRPAPRVGLLGATGAVGREILGLLDEHRLPLGELRVFASEDSVGVELEFAGGDLVVESPEPGRVAACDLLIVAAPDALEPLGDALGDTFVVDLSGALELDPEVPLWLPGRAIATRRVAVPRGVVTGLGIALAPLAAEYGLERVTITTLEPAAGAGRRGLDELQEQVVRTFSSMDGGEDEPSGVFPLPLAFDCLPAVGESDGGDETFEERRLRHVLRRLLEAPGLAVEVTRVRVPTFMGALATVHGRLGKTPSRDDLVALWSATAGLQLVADDELPTPRRAVAHEHTVLGRIRLDPERSTVGFAIALDTLRRGAALGAIEAAALLLER